MCSASMMRRGQGGVLRLVLWMVSPEYRLYNSALACFYHLPNGILNEENLFVGDWRG